MTKQLKKCEEYKKRKMIRLVVEIRQGGTKKKKG